MIQTSQLLLEATSVDNDEMNIIHIYIYCMNGKNKEEKVEGKNKILKDILQTKYNQNDRLFTFQRSRVPTATTQSN